MAATLQRSISKRWGMPFWDIVRDLHAQELTRVQAAAALHYGYQNFAKLLRDNPEKSPWEKASVVTQYLLDTGESLGQALSRLSADGYTLNAASKAIGFKANGGLRYAMKVRGIEVEFAERKAKPKVRHPRPPACKARWPTWARVFEITPDVGGTYVPLRRHRMAALLRESERVEGRAL